jgi:hypothetical protein
MRCLNMACVRSAGLHVALPCACVAGDNDHLQQLTRAVLDFLQQEEFELPSPRPADSMTSP